MLDQLEEGSAQQGLRPERGRRPVRSPEAAEEERYLTEVAADSLAETRERIARHARDRRQVLEEMAASGYFEGRWVGEGDRAVYLERAAEPDAQARDEGHHDGGRCRYEVHRGPWAWVEDAPPGEDPRETLRRGEILARSWAGRRQLCVLVGVPILVASLGQYLLPPAYIPILLAAVVVPLFFCLRHGRRRLLDVLFFGSGDTRRRKAEEIAALAQLELARRGVADVPRLEELTREATLELERKELARGRGGGVLETRVGAPMTGGRAARSSTTRATDEDAVDSGPSVGGAREVGILLSIAAGEKNLGELLAHLRAFSGTAFAPGPGEMADSLSGLERAGLVSKTSGKPPFARYEITPGGVRELHALAANASCDDPEADPLTEAAPLDAGTVRQDTC